MHIQLVPCGVHLECIWRQATILHALKRPLLCCRSALARWFSVGLLQLQRITWEDSPGQLLVRTVVSWRCTASPLLAVFSNVLVGRKMSLHASDEYVKAGEALHVALSRPIVAYRKNRNLGSLLVKASH
jgi:hypothetical protein